MNILRILCATILNNSKYDNKIQSKRGTDQFYSDDCFIIIIIIFVHIIYSIEYALAKEFKLVDSSIALLSDKKTIKNDYN